MILEKLRVCTVLLAAIAVVHPIWAQAPSQPSPRSKPSTTKVTVTFKNSTTKPVTVHWVDFQGRVTKGGTVQPGATTRGGASFSNHVYVVRQDGRDIRTITLGKEARQNFDIKAPSAPSNSPPKPDATPTTTNLSGKWRDTNGGEIQLKQQGNRLTATALNDKVTKYWTTASGQLTGTSVSMTHRHQNRVTATVRGTLESSKLIRWNNKSTWTMVKAPSPDPAPSGRPTDHGNTLAAGGELQLDDTLTSPSREYVLKLERNGNLVLSYVPTKKLIWSSNTADRGVKKASMRNDGSFALFNAQGTRVWSSGPESEIVRQAGGRCSAMILNTGHFSLYTGNTTDPRKRLLRVFGRHRLVQNVSLRTNNMVSSPAGKYVLILYPDGNLNLLHLPTNSVKWQSRTSGKGGKQAFLQGDGNFIIFDANRSPVWTTGSKLQTVQQAGGRCHLEVFDSGELILYAGDANATNKVVLKNLSGNTKLLAGRRLNVGQQLLSSDGALKMELRQDGKLVLSTSDGELVWSTKPHPIGRGGYLEMRSDGTLAIRDSGNRVKWVSGNNMSSVIRDAGGQCWAVLATGDGKWYQRELKIMAGDPEDSASARCVWTSLGMYNPNENDNVAFRAAIAATSSHAGTYGIRGDHVRGGIRLHGPQMCNDDRDAVPSLLQPALFPNSGDSFQAYIQRKSGEYEISYLIASDDSTMFVAFRGSETYANWKMNGVPYIRGNGKPGVSDYLPQAFVNGTTITFDPVRNPARRIADGLEAGLNGLGKLNPGFPKVITHSGWAQGVNDVFPAIVEEMERQRAGGKTVIVTGHSLGGALAGYLMYRLMHDTEFVNNTRPHRLVTFCAPHYAAQLHPRLAEALSVGKRIDRFELNFVRRLNHAAPNFAAYAFENRTQPNSAGDTYRDQIALSWATPAGAIPFPTLPSGFLTDAVRSRFSTSTYRDPRAVVVKPFGTLYNNYTTEVAYPTNPSDYVDLLESLHDRDLYLRYANLRRENQLRPWDRRVYTVKVKTTDDGILHATGTDANVFVNLQGDKSQDAKGNWIKTEPVCLNPWIFRNAFERGQIDAMSFVGRDVGKVNGLYLRHDNGRGIDGDPDWKVDWVEVTTAGRPAKKWNINGWLDDDDGLTRLLGSYRLQRN